MGITSPLPHSSVCGIRKAILLRLRLLVDVEDGGEVEHELVVHPKGVQLNGNDRYGAVEESDHVEEPVRNLFRHDHRPVLPSRPSAPLYVLIDGERLARHSLDAEKLGRTRTAGGGEPRSQIVVVFELQDRGRQGFGIFGRDQDAAVPDNLFEPTRSRCDDGHADEHSFGRSESEAFVA